MNLYDALRYGVAIVALVAGGIASVAGFGIGSLLRPLVAVQYGMKTAVGAVAIPHMTATLLRFWRLRAHVDRHIFLCFGLMNAGGALAGALIHARVTSPVLTIVLGALLICAGILGVSGYAEHMRFGRKVSWIAGAASGGFGGLVGNQGASALQPCLDWRCRGSCPKRPRLRVVIQPEQTLGIREIGFSSLVSQDNCGQKTPKNFSALRISTKI